MELIKDFRRECKFAFNKNKREVNHCRFWNILFNLNRFFIFDTKKRRAKRSPFNSFIEFSAFQLSVTA